MLVTGPSSVRVQAHDQEGSVDPDSFRNSLQECLDKGSFRLVFVLDEVPGRIGMVGCLSGYRDRSGTDD